MVALKTLPLGSSASLTVNDLLFFFFLDNDVLRLAEILKSF